MVPSPATDPAAPEGAHEEAVYNFDADLVVSVVWALAEVQANRVRDLILLLHCADVADLLERLSPDERTVLHDVILFAVITGIVAWLWFSNLTLAVVIAMAMIVNMMVGRLVGNTIPIILDRASKDLAIASGIFLTNMTNMIGF